MPQPVYPWRGRFVFCAAMLLWMAVAARLIHVHVTQRPQLAQKARQQREFVEIIPARPGEIVDRRGRVLATSVTAPSLYIVPSATEQPAAVADAIASVLQIDSQLLTQRIEDRIDKHFLWVKRRLSPEEKKAIEALEIPERSYGFRNEFLRQYPHETLASHVLGLRDIDGNGHGGIEESMEHVLRGEPKHRRIIRDARGNVVAVRDDLTKFGSNGDSVTLTIDIVLQLHVERILAGIMEQWEPESCCAIVMEPNSGELLAMASQPTFNPGSPGDTDPSAWRNRCITDIYEPGSTFKPFVVAWAIDRGLLDPRETFYCENGSYQMGPRTLRDHSRYGNLNVTDILVKSSNIGMAKIGERLENSRLHRLTRAFGFGSPTGVNLPGEVGGIVRPLKKWDHYSTGSIPMGQELACTPLQLITAHCALASGGKLIHPQIVRETGTTSAARNNRYREQFVVSPTVRPEIARWSIEEAMFKVVEDGTGRRGQLEGHKVFGKTGTAQMLDPQTGRYSETEFVCSFICGAPADNPTALVLVVVNAPSLGTSHYGGTVAAEPAAQILKHCLIHSSNSTMPRVVRHSEVQRN